MPQINKSLTTLLEPRMFSSTPSSVEGGHLALPFAPEGTITTQLIPTPTPLTGDELIGIIAFKLAEQLVQTLRNNGKLSPIFAFSAPVIDWKLQLTINNKSGLLDMSLEDPPLDLTLSNSISLLDHPSLVELLRVQSGIGLWHRATLPNGRKVDYQSRPSLKTLEHLAQLLASNEIQNALTKGFNNDQPL